MKTKINLISIIGACFSERFAKTQQSFAMSERKIQELLENNLVTNEEILMKLTCDGCFMDRLNNNCSSKLIDNILALIIRACNCNSSHYRQLLNELLNNLCQSKFWKKTLLDHLAQVQLANEVDLKLKSNQNVIRELLINVIVIITEILRSLEYHAKSVLTMKTILYNILDMPIIKNFVYNDEINQRQSALTTIWHDVVDKKSLSSFVNETRSLVNKNRLDRPPPNSFRALGIFPSENEILSSEKPYLRANIVSGSYDSVEHYLDVQFRLLREDYIEPLRQGIGYYLNPASNNYSKMKVYEKVSILMPEESKNSGMLSYCIQFDESYFKHDYWEASIRKRFLHGSLLCLSPDNFKTILYATVNNKNENDLRNGKLDVTFDMFDGRVNFKEKYIMVESSAYFEAYRCSYSSINVQCIICI